MSVGGWLDFIQSVIESCLRIVSSRSFCFTGCRKEALLRIMVEAFFGLVSGSWFWFVWMATDLAMKK